jgi:pyrroline-5-carboxylate reductase
MAGGDLLLVGCGRMGSALLRGWLATAIAARIVAVEPDGVALEDPSLRVVAKAADIPVGFVPDVVVLAVKPQVMPRLLTQYGRFVRPGTVFLSIAAGRTLGFLAAALGPHAAIVRAMPNTPAAIGRGMSILVASSDTTSEQRARCEAVLAVAGEVAWIEDECLMDAVTAVSGSGPAYVFLMIEALAEAGRKAGLPVPLAERLARQTVIGAAALAAADPADAAALRAAVTSPGGTTAAALGVLMAKDGLQPVMDRAVAAAARRSAELA